MEKYFEDNYGGRIKELRLKMGMTQNQVAAALNVTPGYICNVENNRTAMSLRILTYFAKLTGMTVDSLIGILEPEYQSTALDNALLEKIQKMDDETKKKLLKTIEVWE